MYVPMGQEPDGVLALNLRLLPIVWMARTATEPLTVAASVEGALRRRFWRAGGTLASRYEVEALRARRVTKAAATRRQTPV